MKVFFVDPNNNTPQYNYPIVESLRKEQNIEISYFSTNYCDHTKYYDENYSVNAQYIFSNRISSIKNIKIRRFIKIFSLPLNYFQFYRRVKKEKPAIIHYNWLAVPILDYFFINFFQKMNIKIILNIHNLLQHEKNILRSAELRILNKVDQIVSLSKFTQHSLQEKYKLDSLCIPHRNCYQKELANSDIGEININKKIFSLLFIGGIRPYKGLELLFQTIAKIRNEIDLQVEIIGKCSKKYEKELRILIKKLELSNIVIFENKFIEYKKMITKIKNCSTGILPYQTATQSGVIYFFNSLKKPVIITNAGGLKEQVDEKIAEIAEPEVKSLQKAIIKMKNRIQADNIIDEDFQQINIEQDFTKTVQQFLELYRKLIIR